MQTHLQRSSLVLAAVWGGAAVIVLLSLGRTGGNVDTGLTNSGLTKPIRLEQIHPGAVEELLLGLRVHHYRAQQSDEADYTDYFFDTEDWSLLREGYSYRFRVFETTDQAGRYSLRLEREPRFVDSGKAKLDSRSDVSSQLGDRVAAGDWHLAVVGPNDIPTRALLGQVLDELDLDTNSLEPRLRGQLHRRRFDVTDKGTNWFELDVEEWSFQSFPAVPNHPDVEITNFVLDTRLGAGDPELVRRVETMLMLSRMFHKSRPTQLAAHEQAMEMWGSLSGPETRAPVSARLE